MSAPRVRRFVVAASAAILVGLLGGSPASAHPLGNFSINHLDQLTFATKSIRDDAIVDTAEIPTAQASGTVDANGDGTTTAAELGVYGGAQCEIYRQSLTLTIDARPIEFATVSSTFAYRPGQAGLQTTRLECGFEAANDLTTQQSVEFSNAFARNRVGWKEIVADGDGAQIKDSPVATTSVTDRLTVYPVDLLSSPLDIRNASFTVSPGSGSPGSGTSPATSPKPSPSTFSRMLGPFSHVVDRVNRTFNDLVGRRQLTLGVGLLAIGLALILGASHALLPGHGKTVMAAYIAGRQGSVRDAVLVGATVTATHTGGVLLLGLALTVSTSLAGESVLGWLGVISGLIIAGLGASLLRGAVRRRRGTNVDHSDEHGHSHGLGHSHRFGHSHSHGGHGHSHGGHGHSHGAHTDAPVEHALAFAGSTRQTLVRAVQYDGAVAVVESPLAVLSRPGPTVAPPAHGEMKRFSRRGLIGMGIAGGLVPSPSALVVLLSAIALGRTVFGVVLVIGYGAGMAGTLTLAGVLLVRVRDRYQRNSINASSSRLRTVAARWTRVAPYLTAGLVFVVGLGLAVRSLGAI